MARRQGEHLRLADASGNELGGLGVEVQDHDGGAARQIASQVTIRIRHP